MTKEEFEQRIDNEISNQTYKLIEKVYMFHPSISAEGGKDEIASLYSQFGIRIIADMLPTALKMEEIEKEEFELRNKLDRLKNKKDDIIQAIGFINS